MPISKMPIFCAVGEVIKVGPRDGVCEIIFYETFYVSGRGSFVDINIATFKWFLDYAGSYSGSTQYGIAIEHSKVLDAYSDLNTSAGMDGFQKMWKKNIHHYGLLKFPVHDALVTSKKIVDNYHLLLNRLRFLQEEHRAGARDSAGYLILGIALYALHTGTVHDYLKDLLKRAPIDAVIFRTDFDIRHSRGKCFNTGPSVYVRASNDYEVSLVDAMQYVQRRKSQFMGLSLALSFSLEVIWIYPVGNKDPTRFDIGKRCRSLDLHWISTLCRKSADFKFDLISDVRVMRAIHPSHNYAAMYESNDTIAWKICSSSKSLPTIPLGVALFGLESEDRFNKCASEGVMPYAAGYWRANSVYLYMKNVIRDPGFLIKMPPC